MAARDLCDIDDVVGYVPGFDKTDPDNATIVAKLEALITSQSHLILSETGREIIANGDQPATRKFPIGQMDAWRRIIPVGDMATPDELTIELLAWDRTIVTTIDTAKCLPLYVDREQPTDSWEPITRLSFPYLLGGPIFLAGQWLQVTGTFGFPEIPKFIVEACAARVVIRSLNDAAIAGTVFADAVRNLNIDALFQTAQDALAELEQQVFA